MKLIIAGSRTLNPSVATIKFLIKDFNIKPSEIVTGTANGVDNKGEVYAGHANLNVTRFPAKWNTYGKSAGIHRNNEMANYADALLLIWDGLSKGSKHMRSLAEKYNIPLYEVILRQEQLNQIGEKQ